MSLLLRRSALVCRTVLRTGSSSKTSCWLPKYYSAKHLTKPVLNYHFRLMSSETHPNINTLEVLEEGKKGVLIIDVREQVEIHNTGLIPGSVNIPLGHLEEAMAMDAGEFKNRYSVSKPGKTDRIILSCQSGNRSRKAIAALQKLGFTGLVNNSDGWKGYEELNKPK